MNKEEALNALKDESKSQWKRVDDLIESNGLNDKVLRLYACTMVRERLDDLWPLSKIHVGKAEAYANGTAEPGFNLKETRQEAYYHVLEEVTLLWTLDYALHEAVWYCCLPIAKMSALCVHQEELKISRDREIEILADLINKYQ